MNDRFGRQVRYLRLSITPRCNLNCFYCRPDVCPPGQGLNAASNLLSTVEIGRIVHAAASLANVPLVLKAELETEIRLSQRPAKAGPKE